jgi:S1-C subfamily serine protease
MISARWLSLIAAAVAAAPGAGQESRAAAIEIRAPEVAEQRVLVMGGGKAGGLLSLEEDLTSLYLQLSPSLVEVRSVFTDAAGRREVITAGVVLSEDGFVVAPVYQPTGEAPPQSELWVRRIDGEVFRGRLIAHDARYGLSLLLVPELRGLQPRIFFGEYLMEGAPVIAIGNAFGLESSMSLGLLTGKGRFAGEALRLLQVTNPINPGDGGGLLANVHGHVVGVLMSSLPDLVRAQVPVGIEQGEAMEVAYCDPERAQRASGVGFAVPVEVVIGLFPEHLGPLLRRSRLLGVEVERRLMVLEEPEGPRRMWTLEVRSVLPGSAAAQAGIAAGDCFLELAGIPVTTLETLGVAIFTAPDQSQLTVLRAGEPIILPVDFRARPFPAPPTEAPPPRND